MTDFVPVIKNEANQEPIPTEWRGFLKSIADAFSRGDYHLECGITGVEPVSTDVANRILRNVQAYGGALALLPESVWESSVCQWMGGYWEVLVDLFTVEEGRSDLSLSVKVYEDGLSYRFHVQGVYVP